MLRVCLAVALLATAAPFWAGAQAAEDTAGAAPDAVLHPAGVWWMYPDKGICVVQAELEDGRVLQLLHQDGFAVAVAESGDRKLPRGRRGDIITDQGSFLFTPLYENPGYVISQYMFTDAQMGLLRSTRTLQVRVDGEVLADAAFAEGDGFPGVIDDVAACAAGRPGWWTKAAAP